MEKVQNSHSLNIGAFLGSFDPFHNGHVNVIESVLGQTDLDCVLIIPSMQNPWKENKCADIDIRCEIINASIPVHLQHKVYASMIEKGMGAPYYSYKTLNELSRRLPGDRISIICGCDVLNEVTEWKEFDSEIWPKFGFIGVSRGDGELPTHIELNGVRKEITTVFSGMDENISSTEIRDRIRNGEDCSRLLNQAAIDIINKHKLYI